jgi:hypothetical protein
MQSDEIAAVVCFAGVANVKKNGENGERPGHPPERSGHPPWISFDCDSPYLPKGDCQVLSRLPKQRSLRYWLQMKAAARPSFVRILAESHIAAVAIAFLVFWSVESGVRALYYVISIPTMNFWGAIDISFFFSDFPHAFEVFVDSLRMEFTNEVVFGFLFSALVCLAASWFLSHGVYGVNPTRSLGRYRVRLTRRTNG